MVATKQQEPEPLGTAKFGLVLRRAIKAEFGSSRTFATAIGLSEGRISQLIKGEERIMPATLDLILATFSDLGHREAIHQSWVATFAPEPLQPDDGISPDVEAAELLQAIYPLVELGRAKALVRRLLEVRRSVAEPELRFQVERSAAEVSMHLGRYSFARNLAVGMIERATVERRQEWTARALWLQATATRAGRGFAPAELERSHRQAAEYLGAWNPAGGQASEAKEDMDNALRRDRALTILKLGQGHQIDPVLTAEEAKALHHRQSQVLEPQTQAVFAEVIGRLHLASDDAFAAEDALEEARALRGPSVHQHVKENLLESQVLMLRKEEDAARHLLNQTWERALEVDDLHHASLIEDILVRDVRRA